MSIAREVGSLASDANGKRRVLEVLSPASSDASEHTVNDRNNTSSSNDNNNGYCWHLEVACASSELPVRYKYEIWDDDIEQVIERRM